MGATECLDVYQQRDGAEDQGRVLPVNGARTRRGQCKSTGPS